jgi:hypothetical protein
MREQMLAWVISVRGSRATDTATLADASATAALHQGRHRLGRALLEPEMRPYARHDGVLCIRQHGRQNQGDH